MYNEEPTRIMTNRTTHVIEKLEFSKIMMIRRDLAKMYSALKV
jgi:hypothetical protein